MKNTGRHSETEKENVEIDRGKLREKNIKLTGK